MQLFNDPVSVATGVSLYEIKGYYKCEMGHICEERGSNNGLL
jgi:hypothetical protein